MAMILGALLCLGVVAFTLPHLIKYCNQTSATPEEIIEEKGDEENEEEKVIQQELPTRGRSEIKTLKVKERKEEKKVVEKTGIIGENELEEETEVEKEICLEREYLKIDEKKKTNDPEETIQEEAEETVIKSSTPSSNKIIRNVEECASAITNQQPITVEALIHENNPISIVPESLDSTNSQTPVNDLIPNFPKKKRTFRKRVKKIFTSFSKNTSPVESRMRKSRSSIEESGSSIGIDPLAHSTILNPQCGAMNLQIRNSNGILSIFAQPPNGRNNSTDISFRDSGLPNSIGTSTTYRDLPNGGNNFVSLPLANSAAVNNVTYVSFVMSYDNSDVNRSLNEQLQTIN